MKKVKEGRVKELVQEGEKGGGTDPDVTGSCWGRGANQSRSYYLIRAEDRG